MNKFPENARKDLENLKKEREDLYKKIRGLSYESSPDEFNSVLDDIVFKSVLIGAYEFLIGD